MWRFVWLGVLGFGVGAYGTLIGSGGGFVLMPVLLLLYPDELPELLASISLAVVFFNALSGSIAYARMGRVDYRSGMLFAISSIPGAILGAMTTAAFRRRVFDTVFGLLLLAACIILLRSSRRAEGGRDGGPAAGRRWARSLVETDGTRHSFAFDPALGAILSVAIGFLSSLLGIGGGIIHVPSLVYLLGFPVHIATATSQFVLAIMALAGTLVHIAAGVFVRGWRRTIALSVGVLLGAPLGARLSTRIHGGWIIRGLAVALGIVGLRILLKALTGA